MTDRRGVRRSDALVSAPALIGNGFAVSLGVGDAAPNGTRWFRCVDRSGGVPPGVRGIIRAVREIAFGFRPVGRKSRIGTSINAPNHRDLDHTLGKTRAPGPILHIVVT